MGSIGNAVLIGNLRKSGVVLSLVLLLPAIASDNVVVAFG